MNPNMANNNNASQEPKLFTYPLMGAPDARVSNSGTLGLFNHPRQDQVHTTAMMHASASSSSSAIPGLVFNLGKDMVAPYDMGDLDRALFLYLDGQDPQAVMNDQRRAEENSSDLKLHTLNIFPSQPMHVEPSSSSATTSMLNAGLGPSPSTSGSRKSSEPSIDLSNHSLGVASASGQATAVKVEGSCKGPASSSFERDVPRTPDPKTLRRLAQNREAARKSRLRKKAYIQQLESSRVRLAQLEQELQRARSQGVLMGASSILGGDQGTPVANPDTALFDMEYARWLEEHHRLVGELRGLSDESSSEDELRVAVQKCLAHFDQLINLKAAMAKSDVFHLTSGMWRTPAERCFLWIGGSRPSDLIKIILNQVQPLSEQQVLGIYSLQQSTQEAEEALSQGLEALNSAIRETVAADSLLVQQLDMNAFMAQMTVAINKMATLEGFVRQADNLRQQILHRLHQLLSTRQAARSIVAMAEYFHRLRALSSLWQNSRPRGQE